MATSDGTTAETPDLVGQAMRIAFDGASPRIATPLPSQIGPYRVTGWLGEGGMGVVYEAEQAHPQRSVAVKVIREDLVNPRLIARFQREAEVLGQLTHAGIATVFESGTWAEGPRERPFIAMEMIAGEELTRYAEQNGLDTRGRLELMAQVCDAVEHAHRHGFIHRDLKPSNILVLPGGQPKVLDFGLARAVMPDQPAASASVSAEGGIVGTPLYMSPQQLSAGSEGVDTRSDIYSLGVVMFQLLAGRLPYDLPALPTFQDIRAAIVDKAPLRLAQLDKRFKGDVSSIVAKTLEKEPQDRYQSAGELAADIRRFLAGAPIAAHHATAVERAWRFGRRNPSIALLAATIVVLLLALAIGGPVLAVRATRAQRHADARASETREVLDYLTQVSADRLDGRQPVAAVRTEILTRALGYYQQYVQEQRGQGELFDLAKAYFHLGYVASQLARHDEARQAYQRAIGLLSELIHGRPEDLQSRGLLAEAYSNLGNLESALARFAPARQLLESARGEYERLAAAEPESLQPARSLAMNWMHRGVCDEREGRYAEAEAKHQAALKRLAELAQRQPQDRSLQQSLGLVHRSLGKLYFDVDRYAEARDAFQAAQAVHERLLAADPENVEAKRGLAWSSAYLGTLFRYLGSPDEGLAALRKAADLQRELVEDFPLVLGDREDLGRTLHNWGFALLNLGRQEESERLLQEAVQQRRRLVRSQADNIAWRCSLANSLVQLATVRQEQQRHAEAQPDLEEACSVMQRAIELAPQHLEARRILRRVGKIRGWNAYHRGDFEAAVKSFDDGLAQHEILSRIRVGWDDRLDAGQILDGRARALLKLGRKQDAVVSFERAAEQWTAIGDPIQLYNAGCALALCVPVVDEAARGGFEQRAVAALRKAVEQGFPDLDHLKTDPDLESLRQHPKFAKLIVAPQEPPKKQPQ